MRLSRRGGEALLLLASGVGCLALFEAAVRLFIPVTDIPWHRSDPVVAYGLEPGQDGQWIRPGAFWRIGSASAYRP